MKNIMVLLLIIVAYMVLVSCGNEETKADAYGNFETREYEIAAETNGRILTVYVSEGDKINTGDIIAVVDTMQLHLHKKELMARISALDSRTLDVQTQINALLQRKQNILREKKRIESLYEKKAATEKQLDDIKGELEVVESEILAGEESIRTSNTAISKEILPLQVNISKTMDMIDKSIIRSPISGRVMELYSGQGEYAIPGKLVIKAADTDIMILRAYLSGAQLDRIKLNEEVGIRFDKGEKGYHNRRGRVIWVSSESEFTPKLIRTKEDRVNLVYAVKIEVDNAEGLIKTGMPGEVLF
ncbi:MAG: HlyD family secretion protein [Candidatus Kapaibacterium sp.]